VQRGQQVGERLAAAGAGTSHNVAPLERPRDALGLRGGGVGRR
jgi:hypothetical protein